MGAGANRHHRVVSLSIPSDIFRHIHRGALKGSQWKSNRRFGSSMKNELARAKHCEKNRKVKTRRLPRQPPQVQASGRSEQFKNPRMLDFCGTLRVAYWAVGDCAGSEAAIGVRGRTQPVVLEPYRVPRTTGVTRPSGSLALPCIPGRPCCQHLSPGLWNDSPRVPQGSNGPKKIRKNSRSADEPPTRLIKCHQYTVDQ